LFHSWPVQVIIELPTGLDGAFLKSSVAVIDLAGGLKIGGDLPKARFVLVGCMLAPCGRTPLPPEWCETPAGSCYERAFADVSAQAARLILLPGLERAILHVNPPWFFAVSSQPFYREGSFCLPVKLS